MYGGQKNINYSGVVEAKKTTALSFINGGTLMEIRVVNGNEVRKGQLLAKSDPSTAQNLYEAALSQQRRAKDAYDRLKPMKENGTLPEIQWVEAETGLAQANSAVAIAKKGIKDSDLYAPENGVIGNIYAQVGMNVVPTQPVMELLDIESVFIKIPVSENEISYFEKGKNAQITINAINKNVTGTVKEIGVKADVLSYTYPVRIEVDNTDGLIKPGMICSVTTKPNDNRSGVLISNKALQKDLDGEQFIFIVKNGRAEKISVNTISLIENKVLISGEVPSNAQVIISGQQKLNTGTPVKVIN